MSILLKNYCLLIGCQRVLVIDGGVKASRKVCAAVRSGVRVAKSTAGINKPGIEIVTGIFYSNHNLLICILRL